MKKGGFQKGRSGNPNGRPPKAINKISRSAKEQISDFINEKFAEIPKVWKELPVRDKVRLLVDLLPYVVPKMAAITVDADVNINALNEAEIDMLAKKLLNYNRNEKDEEK